VGVEERRVGGWDGNRTWVAGTQVKQGCWGAATTAAVQLSITAGHGASQHASFQAGNTVLPSSSLAHRDSTRPNWRMRAGSRGGAPGTERARFTSTAGHG